LAGSGRVPAAAPAGTPVPVPVQRQQQQQPPQQPVHGSGSWANIARSGLSPPTRPPVVGELVFPCIMLQMLLSEA
jgi:hypothetical protein